MPGLGRDGRRQRREDRRLSAVLDRVRKIKGIETTETSIHLQNFRVS
jgi:hypothetical protein